MYGFGVLNRGPAGVSWALHGQPKKKLKKKERKTGRGKVLDLKILNLNRKTMMKYG